MPFAASGVTPILWGEVWVVSIQHLPWHEGRDPQAWSQGQQGEADDHAGQRPDNWANPTLAAKVFERRKRICR